MYSEESMLDEVFSWFNEGLEIDYIRVKGHNGDEFNEMFPINRRNNEALIELFNEYQKETPFGYYIEIKKEQQ